MIARNYRLSDKGARMLTGFEAMILHVYNDQVGIPTVCVGHVVKPEDELWIRDGVTRDECAAVLKRDVARFENRLNSVVKVRLTQPMVDALVSLEFNIGEGAFASSTVVARLNQGDYSGAADAFTMWRWANVKQKDGTHQRRPILLGRRESEAALFRSGILEVTLGAPSEEPSLDSLLARAKAAQFDTFAMMDLGVDWPTGAHRREPEPSNDALTEDGRLTALPPDEEDQAA